MANENIWDDDPWISDQSGTDDWGTGEDTPKSKPIKNKKSGIKVNNNVAVILSLVLIAVLVAAAWMAFMNPREDQPAQAGTQQTQQDKNQSKPQDREETHGVQDTTPMDPYRETVDLCYALMAAGDMDGAIEYARGMAEADPDPRYRELLEDLEVQKMNGLLDTARCLAEDGDYRQAIQRMVEAWNETGDETYYNMAAQLRREFGIYQNSVVAAGKFNTIFRMSDGTVRIYGDNSYGENSASSWTNIIGVSIGDRHVVALTDNGSLISAGESLYGQRDVNSWRNVIAISAGDVHTVGLREDGTVMAAGHNVDQQCEVDDMMRAAGDQKIVAIAAGYTLTVGLLEDGRVVSCGADQTRARQISYWQDIAAVYAGTHYAAGLCVDGTVVAAGKGSENWDLSQWTNMVALAAGDYFLIGLRADGQMLSVGDVGSVKVSQWDGLDLKFISAGHDHAVGVLADGTVVVTGKNGYGQGNCAGVKVFEGE